MSDKKGLLSKIGNKIQGVKAEDSANSIDSVMEELQNRIVDLRVQKRRLERNIEKLKKSRNVLSQNAKNEAELGRETQGIQILMQVREADKQIMAFQDIVKKIDLYAFKIEASKTRANIKEILTNAGQALMRAGRRLATENFDQILDEIEIADDLLSEGISTENEGIAQVDDLSDKEWVEKKWLELQSEIAAEKSMDLPSKEIPKEKVNELKDQFLKLGNSE